jgi:cadaverine:lysine antiporter/arginine:agmatine antiporter
MGTKGIHNWLIVSISSIFIISAFVSATLGELWLVIALVMTVLAVYAIRLTPNKKS